MIKPRERYDGNVEVGDIGRNCLRPFNLTDIAWASVHIANLKPEMSEIVAQA